MVPPWSTVGNPKKCTKINCITGRWCTSWEQGGEWLDWSWRSTQQQQLHETQTSHDYSTSFLSTEAMHSLNKNLASLNTLLCLFNICQIELQNSFQHVTTKAWCTWFKEPEGFWTSTSKQTWLLATFWRGTLASDKGVREPTRGWKVSPSNSLGWFQITLLDNHDLSIVPLRKWVLCRCGVVWHFFYHTKPVWYGTIVWWGMLGNNPTGSRR